jgi:hypothetical protein
VQLELAADVRLEAMNEEAEALSCRHVSDLACHCAEFGHVISDAAALADVPNAITG